MKATNETGWMLLGTKMIEAELMFMLETIKGTPNIDAIFNALTICNKLQEELLALDIRLNQKRSPSGN